MKLFIYEMICAGGLGEDPPASLRAEGWAMLAALVEDFERARGVQTLTLLGSFCRARLGRFCHVASQEEEPAVFRDMVIRADAVLLIAPEFDGHLARRTRFVQDAGKMLLGSSVAAVELAGDKWALAAHLARHGVPTPPTIRLAAALGPERVACSFPAVCKPRYGAGSQATFLVHSQEHFALCRANADAEMPGADFVLQPLAPGLVASVTFLIGPSQRLALEPAEQILSTDDRFRYLGGRLPLPPLLAHRAKRLGERAVATTEGLHGFVGVDLVLGAAADGSADAVIEINPRPTTSYIGLRQLAEDNLADALLQLARANRIPPIRWRRGPLEFAPAVSRR
jgi:predicted ATP-grasp superfamily ATP-dependent carboligase